jgi:hypothetical protein
MDASVHKFLFLEHPFSKEIHLQGAGWLCFRDSGWSNGRMPPEHRLRAAQSPDLQTGIAWHEH